MNTFQSEQKKRRKLRARKQWSRRKVILLASVIILGYLVVFFGSLHYRSYVVMDHRLSAGEKLQKQKLATIKSLEDEKIKLQNPAYVKELARKQLYYMDKNEVHIKIEPDPSKEPETGK